jgi:hypothetical protein
MQQAAKLPMTASPSTAAPRVPSVDDTPVRMEGDSPEARMSRRFPQKIKISALLGIPVVADDRKILGVVKEVNRDPAGKIKLIVAYSRWFGFFPRDVAVPLERVGILGRQVGSIDMDEQAYIAAPTWSRSNEVPIPPDEIIRIALAKR